MSMTVEFNARKYIAKILSSKVDFNKATGDYEIRIDFKGDTQMTQRPFKVGDEIIMEVHTKNNQLPDIGEYKGVIGGVDDYEIEAILKEQGMSARWTFSSTSLENKRWGAEVSIRHADEVSRKDETMWRLTFLKDWRDIKSGTVFEGVKLGNNNWIYFNNGKCAIQSTDSHIVRLEPIPYGGNGRTVDVVIIDDMMPTPQKQEWVKGLAPKVGEREKAIWIFAHGWDKPLYYAIDELIFIGSYEFWRYVELPPPPPVEEVEAYGMLEAVDKFIIAHNKNALQDKNNREESLARALSTGIMHLKAFYSLPATAENLEKYLKSNTGDKWNSGYDNITLDRLINKSQHVSGTLYFTAAALEALGVK